MPSVSDFLLERLQNAGVKHVFGVPGDYVLNLYKKLSDSEDIELITNTDEAHAGFAADAYARMNGVGCVCTTYNVGSLKVANAIACAYAERSPVIVISGSPGMKERNEGVMLHHMVRSFDCQKKVFENITCASEVLDDPTTAGFKIDSALEALKYHKRPVYLELPRDIADKVLTYDVYKQGTPASPKSDKQNLSEALEEVSDWIRKSKNPVILAGVQIARYGLGTELVKFAEKLNIPIAVTMLSKSVVGERHPLFAGVYAGKASHDHVRELVEGSDCVLIFGDVLNDMTLSFSPMPFVKRQVVTCSVEGLKVRGHTYPDVLFEDFAKSLFKEEFEKRNLDFKNPVVQNCCKYSVGEDKKITIARFFEKIGSVLDESMAVVADIGDSLFGAFDLVVGHKNHFLSPAFYTSMGFAIPAALGVQVAKPAVRPLVLVGDGAFQMSCTELSTILSRHLNPIVFIINNRGYTTERFLLDGPFNDIVDWNYHKIVDMIGGGIGLKVETELELESALNTALKNKELTVINVVFESNDISPALLRMTEGLSKQI